MLTQLIPEQISNLWDIIKYAIEQSLPPNVVDSPDKINKILSACLSGKIQVWASYERGESNKFEGIMLTKFLYDDVTEQKNLLIYSVYGYSEISQDSWINGLKALTKFAISRNCSMIVAYSNVEKIIQVVNNLGGDSNWHFLSFDLSKLINLI